MTNWNQVDPSFPDQELVLGGAGHGLRDVRLLHRRHQRRGGGEPGRLQRHRGRQRHRPARSPASRAALGYFGYTYYEQNQDTAERRRDRRRLGLCRPEPGGRAGRQLHAARTAALRLREDGVAREARGCRLRAVPARQQRRDQRGCALHPAQRRAARRLAGSAGCRAGLENENQRDRGYERHQRRGRPAGSPAGRPQAALGRGRDQVVPGRLRLRLGRDDDRHRHRAPRAGDRVLPGDRLHRLHYRGPLGTTVRAPGFRRPPPPRRDDLRNDLGHAHHDPVRPRRGDLPLRVRETGSAEVAEARPRGAGRDSDSRLRVLRAPLHDAAAPGHRHRRRHVQRAERGPRDRRPAHPHRRLHLRGRHVSGAARPAGRAPTRSARRSTRWRPGSSSRRRSRASSRASCSGSRARSERR